MYKSFSMELAGRTLTVDVGRVAAQANGAAFMHYGDKMCIRDRCEGHAGGLSLQAQMPPGGAWL